MKDEIPLATSDWHEHASYVSRMLKGKGMYCPDCHVPMKVKDNEMYCPACKVRFVIYER